MKTGDAVTDSQGRTWHIGEMLGRGLWGTSWSAKDAAGRDWVLKVPLRSTDLPSDTPMPDGIVKASRDALIEQGDLLRKAEFPFLVRLEEKIQIPEGATGTQPALVLQKYPSSMKRKLAAGSMALSDALGVLRTVARQCEALGVHGNLRPSNVLFNERGDPVLSDVLTPALHPWWPKLESAALDREQWQPPEAEGAPRAGWDTWAMCTLLYRAAMLPPGSRDGRREERIQLPRNGLDKVELATLRDRVLARLREDKANPRFGPRLAEALGKFLNRGLSRETEPSPPYRFEGPSAFRPRLDEIVELVDPRIETVGQVLLSNEAKNGVYQGGDAVKFSVTIGVSAGVQSHEDVATGVQLLDLDADPPGRVPIGEMAFTAKAHHAGRWRFDFSIPGLAPGRFKTTVGFRIRDAEGEWANASGEFEVRPPPGYVPPAEDPPSKVPLALPSRLATYDPDVDENADDGAPGRTHGKSREEDTSDPSTFDLPRPIAPSPGDRPRPTAVAPPPPRSVQQRDTETEPDSGPPGLRIEHYEPHVVGEDDVTQRGAPGRVETPRPMVRPPIPMPAPIAGLDVQVRRSIPGEEITAVRSPPGRADPPTAPPAPGPAAPVDWDDVNDARGVNESFLPGHGGADLPENDPPTAAGRNPASAFVERVIDWIRRDYYTAFMVGITFMILMLITVYAITRVL
jgi:hypothetical protein